MMSLLVVAIDLVIITPQPREPYISDDRKVYFFWVLPLKLKAMHTTPTVSASVLTE